MLVDKRIIDWRNKMRKVMFNNFDEHKMIGDALLIVRARDDKLDHLTFDLSQVPEELLRETVVRVIDKSNPEAYIVITNNKMVLKPADQIEAMIKEHKDAGSISKMKDSKDIIVFTYETKAVGSVEIYEIINTEKYAVLNRSTLLNVMDIEENVFFQGLLNQNRHQKLIQMLN